jgi:hypothetical protein
MFESSFLDLVEDMDDDHYHKKRCREDPQIAYKASLQLIFAHMADFHMYVLDCISKKYGHTPDELVNTIRESPEWKTLYVHPTLRQFTEGIELQCRRGVVTETKEEQALPKIKRKKLVLPKAEPKAQGQ